MTNTLTRWVIDRNTSLKTVVILFASRLLFDGLERSGTKIQSIRDVATTTSGGTPSRRNAEYFEGHIPWLKSGELNDGLVCDSEEHITKEALENSSAKLFPEGTLLVALYGATTGKTGILGIEAATNQAICAVMPKGSIDRDYLYWFFRMKRQDFLTNSYGGAQPNISQKTINDSLLPVPPLEIQRDVVLFLSAVNSDSSDLNTIRLVESIADAQKRIIQVKNILESIDKGRALRDQATEELRILESANRFEIFKKLSSVGYPLIEISEVAPINMGQSPPGSSYNTSGNGVPLLNGPTEFGRRSPTAIQWTTAPTKLCKKGDILICVRGATTGRMNWADRDYCIGRGLAALTPRPEFCVSEYIYEFIETQTRQMLSLTAGSTFPNLPGAKLKRLVVPIPPIIEQRFVVEYLKNLREKLDKLEKLIDEAECEMGELIPSILDKASRGNCEDRAYANTFNDQR
jgi:type I restriction enzyme S subunit